MGLRKRGLGIGWAPALAFGVLIVGGCATGNDELSTTTTSLASGGTPAVVVTSSTTSTANSEAPSTTGTPTAPTDERPANTTTTLSQDAVPVGSANDRSGDHGLGGAAYADLLAVELTEIGSRLSVRVTFAGPLPARLPEDEVQGVGVDLYVESAPPDQSDWQLFADGTPDGWFGYLDGPEGPFDLPGSLTIDGATLRFEIQWSEINDPAKGSFSAFADWVRDGTPLNTVAEDHVPDRGVKPFERS